MSKKAARTIHDSIQYNNRITIFLILVIVLCSLFNLISVDICQNRMAYYNNQQTDINNVLYHQQKWLWELNNSIYNGTEFSDSISKDDCTFGKWAAAHTDINAELAANYDTATNLHSQLHELAAEALTLSKTDQEAAADILNNQIVPIYDTMNQGAQSFEDFFHNKSEFFHKGLIGFIIFAICANTVLFFVAYSVAKRLGNRLSNKVSIPITAVAQWSEALSNGSSDLEFDSTMDFDCDLEEVNTMVESFKAMAESIEENVRVVEKVANGDMTAFVNIRSSSDSLGKNLYRMVQSNDLMFAEISEIAQTVAQGAKSISQASNSLAESNRVQAGAIQQFTKLINETSQSIHANSDQAKDAKDLSAEIQDEVMDGTEKMARLLEAVGEIRRASEKVSTMISTIDEIASQTNLLALNASVEAARAGEAGKGFAVVASEVKNLAAKSSQAADESKKLVADTIQKSVMGDSLSQEASKSFEVITGSIEKITGMTEIISKNSSVQESNILSVQNTIQEINDVVASTAEASQETATQSAELKQSSAALKEAMNKFNLRKRTPGKPYIPPEKKNDPEFIRTAEENYQKALKEGKVALPEKTL